MKETKKGKIISLLEKGVDIKEILRYGFVELGMPNQNVYTIRSNWKKAKELEALKLKVKE